MLREPGALTAALNWYRAMIVERVPLPSHSNTAVTPTVFWWGNKDEAVGRFHVQ